MRCYKTSNNSSHPPTNFQVSKDPESLVVIIPCYSYICCWNLYLTYLEPETSIKKWLFPLDESKSLHEKWFFHQTSTKNWLFGVPGTFQFESSTCRRKKLDTVFF